MQTFELGNGVRIPSVGLGVFRLDDQKAAYDAVLTALTAGYRHIDTAMIYQNEQAVGRAIKDSGVPRKDIFLTTKLWNDDQRTGKIAEAMDASLKRLGMDYVDLYLVHWPVKERPVGEVWAGMEKIYKAGKSRAIGVSNYNPHHLDTLLKSAEVVPAVNQIERYPYLVQSELLDYCKAKNIFIEAWGPLGAGRSEVLQDKVLTELAAKYHKTVAQIILRWNNERGVIVIPKSVHRERMVENRSIFDFQLTADELAKIDALDRGKRLGADPETFDF